MSGSFCCPKRVRIIITNNIMNYIWHHHHRLFFFQVPQVYFCYRSSPCASTSPDFTPHVSEACFIFRSFPGSRQTRFVFNSNQSALGIHMEADQDHITLTCGFWSSVILLILLSSPGRRKHSVKEGMMIKTCLRKPCWRPMRLNSDKR